MQRTGGRGGDVGQVDGGLGGRGQLDLGTLSGLLEALAGHLVLGEVDAVLVLELRHQPFDDLGVPVVTTEPVVTVGGLDLKDAIGNVKEGDVEGATTQVEHQDGLLRVALVEAVGQGGGSGLVDDAVHGQARDLAGLLRGLAFGVGEVGGDGDHGIGDSLAQVGLGVPLQLLQDEGRDLLRAVVLAVNVHLPVRAHVTLDGADGAVGVGDRLTLRHFTHENLTGGGEGDHGRSGAGSLGVGDDGGLATLEDSDDRVGGAEVDAYCTCHLGYLLIRCAASACCQSQAP